MSLIFKALQRFDSPEVTQDEGLQDLPPKRNAYTMRKLLLSPPIAFGAAAAIFLVGLAASQVVHFFPHKIKPLTPTVQAATSGEPVTPNPAAKATIEVGADSEPEIAQPVSTEDMQKVSFQVHPPEPDTPSVVSGSAASDAVRFQIVEKDDERKEGGDSPQSVPSTPMRAAALLSKENKAAVSPLNVDQTKDASDKNGVPPSTVLSLVRYDDASPLKLSENEYEDSGLTSSKDAESQKGSDTNPQYKRQADQATKHLQVSQLANRIYGAIQADDVFLASNLLAKLTRMKGADNPFVLKLKAFSLIRQDRLEEARKMLSNVLAQSADDLDAGLNMAVIDMKSGHLDSARRRLVQLQEIFPEDTNIAMYLSKLPH